jgi:hypothetical protein
VPESGIGTAKGRRWLRYAGGALGLLWAGFWTIFGLLSGMGEGSGLAGVVIHAAVPGLIYVAAVMIAWRWAPLGGIVLLLCGLGTLFYYSTARTAQGFVTLVLPAVACAFLLLADYLRQPEP